LRQFTKRGLENFFKRQVLLGEKSSGRWSEDGESRRQEDFWKFFRHESQEMTAKRN
jgi:hypothetical protein